MCVRVRVCVCVCVCVCEWMGECVNECRVIRAKGLAAAHTHLNQVVGGQNILVPKRGRPQLSLIPHNRFAERDKLRVRGLPQPHTSLPASTQLLTRVGTSDVGHSAEHALPSVPAARLFNQLAAPAAENKEKRTHTHTYTRMRERESVCVFVTIKHSGWECASGNTLPAPQTHSTVAYQYGPKVHVLRRRLALGQTAFACAARMGLSGPQVRYARGETWSASVVFVSRAWITAGVTRFTRHCARTTIFPALVSPSSVSSGKWNRFMDAELARHSPLAPYACKPQMVVVFVVYGCMCTRVREKC